MLSRLKPIFNIFALYALLISLLGSAVTVTPARAASITVTTTADSVDASANCPSVTVASLPGPDGQTSFREAVCAANNNAGADTITFSINGTFTLVGAANEDNSSTGDLDIKGSLTIQGNGSSNTILDGSGNERIFDVFPPSAINFNLSGITIQNGDTRSTSFKEGGAMYLHNNVTTTLTNVQVINNFSGANGAIENRGNLTISNSVISGNQTIPASGNVTGGAIHNAGFLTIDQTTINNNSVRGEGGGIASSTGSSVVVNITNSTISNNTASVTGGGLGNGGGISTTGTQGTINITNSTISNNHADNNGGGMYINSGTATVTVTNSTLSGNSANGGFGGGGILNNAVLNYANTIIANSPAGADCIGGIIGTNINNLVEDGSCSTGGVNFQTGDPLLDPLADNGGSTETMALQTGSNAIDKGDATTCTNIGNKDQRGVTRPQGAACDIGAYETGAIIPVVTASNPSAGATLTSLSSITVVFNQDMLDNATADGAENVNNYILVERGTNGTFDTTSCNGGVVSDDAQQTISSASYNSAGFITLLTLASPLTAGTYRFFVCGTTSIWSAAGLELNSGASDYTVDFTITAASGTGSPTETSNTSASALPATGFAPNKVTNLSAQPANLKYAKLGDLVLEIPSLNVKSAIVGVPETNGEWDVTWLGNSVGWLNGTAFPTWTGNSVLTAHVTNASGLEGPFAALKSLKYGDQIIIHMGGAQYIYEVRNSEMVRPTSTGFAFESKSDAAYLTLITCQGYNPLSESYLFRRVVRAVLIQVK